MASKKIVVVLTAVAALLAGCSGAHSPTQPNGEERSSTQPAVRNFPTVHIDRFRVTRPLDRYAPDDRAGVLLKRAEAVVANRCLRSLGYRRHPLDEHPRSTPEPNVFEFYWFPQADRSGYATPDEARIGASWDDTATRTQKELLSGKLTAYRGHRVPKDGCYGVAGRALTKDAQPPRVFNEQGMTITRVTDASPRGLIGSYVSVIRQVLSYQIAKDSRIERVVSQWSSCMNSKGYHYTSPTQAATDKRWLSTNGKTTSKAEIATATADMTCKKRIHYLDVVVAVESAYENRYIGQHPARMNEFLRLRNGWQQNAQRILS